MITDSPCPRWSRPWLWLPSQLAHDLSPILLPIIATLRPLREATYRRFEWHGLHFRNPLGIAGGVDKSGSSLLAWQKLGAGFLEVGTVTPKGQGPNPGKIMDRDPNSWALWNKMGFPNPGLEVVRKNLRSFMAKKQVPLFVNIGKNRETSNENASQDYIKCMEGLLNYADVFVVNISSPNTKGLRDLQKAEALLDFLQPIMARRKLICPEIPVLIKLSPDLERQELEKIIDASRSLVDGWILTNTTQHRTEKSPFAQEGGVSGGPLREMARERLGWLVSALGDNRENKLVISVGGIITADEAKARLDMGAHLVQSYSGLVYQGPGFFRRVLNSLRSHTTETMGH